MAFQKVEEIYLTGTKDKISTFLKIVCHLSEDCVTSDMDDIGELLQLKYQNITQGQLPAITPIYTLVFIRYHNQASYKATIPKCHDDQQ